MISRRRSIWLLGGVIIVIIVSSIIVIATVWSAIGLGVFRGSVDRLAISVVAVLEFTIRRSGVGSAGSVLGSVLSSASTVVLSSVMIYVVLGNGILWSSRPTRTGVRIFRWRV